MALHGSESGDSEEDEQICPLCCNEMDVTDRHFKPCSCGYQICAWCWHQLLEIAAKDNTTARCPACRAEYDKDAVSFSPPTTEELERAGKKKDKQKDKQKSSAKPESTSLPKGGHQQDLLAGKKQHQQQQPTPPQQQRQAGSNGNASTAQPRLVVQKNSVYVTGLPANVCKEETLRRGDFFGRYGRIQRLAVSKGAVGSAGGSVHVIYSRQEEAERCIQALDGHAFEGRTVRACFGTNRLCPSVSRGEACRDRECTYAHDASASASFEQEGSQKNRQAPTSQAALSGNSVWASRGAPSSMPQHHHQDARGQKLSSLQEVLARQQPPHQQQNGRHRSQGWGKEDPPPFPVEILHEAVDPWAFVAERGGCGLPGLGQSSQSRFSFAQDGGSLLYSLVEGNAAHGFGHDSSSDPSRAPAGFGNALKA